MLSNILMEELFLKQTEISPALTTDLDIPPQFSLIFENEAETSQKLIQHRAWLKSIRHERPAPSHPFKVGIYIRYFNQTKYDNYLAYHKKQFADTIALCPNWKLTGFYVDMGSTAPNMENAPEWSRLVQDCMDQKIDLIITQKVSNISRYPEEVTFCSRVLAALQHPVGIYFISEDIFTLASYYQEDLLDPYFLPENNDLKLPADYPDET